MWNAIIGLLRKWPVALTVPISWTGYRSMRDLITLIDAILDTYDNTDLQPHDGITYCNLAVNFVATAMGCKAFAGLTADQILDLVENNECWSDVPFEKAQDMANQGTLVVAGLTSQQLNQEHGHVVVIRPGKPCYSGKWGKTPRCLNIGEQNFIARAKKGSLINAPVGVNEAFIPLPKFWAWRPSL